MSGRLNSPIIDLLVLFILVFIAQLAAAVVDLFAALFVLSPPVQENPWTIITSVYAHAGPGHLVSNAVALVLFGWPVARATTRGRFHLFFLVAGAMAGISQIVISNALADLPLIEADPTLGVLGASGAVFALLGYLLASNRLTVSVSSTVTIPKWATYLLFIIVAAALTYATAQPGVALIAHFTGLLIGLIAGRFNLLRERK